MTSSLPRAKKRHVSVFILKCLTLLCIFICFAQFHPSKNFIKRLSVGVTKIGATQQRFARWIGKVYELLLSLNWLSVFAMSERLAALYSQISIEVNENQPNEQNTILNWNFVGHPFSTQRHHTQNTIRKESWRDGKNSTVKHVQNEQIDTETDGRKTKTTNKCPSLPVI